jgi:hypothetical protein
MLSSCLFFATPWSYSDVTVFLPFNAIDFWLGVYFESFAA